MLTGMGIIILEFAMTVACDVDVLTAVWTAAIIEVANDIGVDVFNMNEKGLLVMMTALELALPAP